jgi:hypothetical protein
LELALAVGGVVLIAVGLWPVDVNVTVAGFDGDVRLTHSRPPHPLHLDGGDREPDTTWASAGERASREALLAGCDRKPSGSTAHFHKTPSVCGGEGGGARGGGAAARVDRGVAERLIEHGGIKMRPESNGAAGAETAVLAEPLVGAAAAADDEWDASKANTSWSKRLKCPLGSERAYGRDPSTTAYVVAYDLNEINRSSHRNRQFHQLFGSIRLAGSTADLVVVVPDTSDVRIPALTAGLALQYGVQVVEVPWPVMLAGLKRDRLSVS